MARIRVMGGRSSTLTLLCVLLAARSTLAFTSSTPVSTPSTDMFNCADTGFQCGNGKCIPPGWNCDGFMDCVDGSDENSTECETPLCLDSLFKCDTGKVFTFEWQCDGLNDCGDYSDENPQLCYGPRKLVALEETETRFQVTWENPHPRYQMSNLSHYVTEITPSGHLKPRQQAYNADKSNYSEVFTGLEAVTTYKVTVTLFSSNGNQSDFIIVTTQFPKPHFKGKPSFANGIVHIPSIVSTEKFFGLFQCRLEVHPLIHNVQYDCSNHYRDLRYFNENNSIPLVCNPEDQELYLDEIKHIHRNHDDPVRYVFGVLLIFGFGCKRDFVYICSEGTLSFQDGFSVGTRIAASIYPTHESEYFDNDDDTDQALLWSLLGGFALFTVIATVLLILWLRKRNINRRGSHVSSNSELVLSYTNLKE